MCEVCGTDRGAQICADQRHAGYIHGALAMPLHHAASSFFADRAGTRDFENFLIEHGIERASWPYSDRFGLFDLEADFAGAFARQGRSRGELSADTEIRRAAPSSV